MAQRSTAASSGVRLVNSLVTAIARGQHDATHLSSIMSSSDVTNEVVLYLSMREAGRIGRAAIPDDQHMDKDEVLWCAYHIRIASAQSIPHSLQPCAPLSVCYAQSGTSDCQRT